MKIIAVACVVVLAVGCGKKDDCSKLYDRSASSMKDMPMPKGKTMDDFKKEFLAECRKDPAKYTGSPEGKCLLAAKDDAAAAECMKKAMGDYRGQSRKTEAALQLNKLAKNAKVFYVTSAQYPKGKAATLPADNGAPGCCGGGDGKCKVSTAWATDPVWSQLDFQIDEPTLFRYSYESADGKSFTATAVGDLDCDGVTITYTLTGTAEAGNPATNLAEPAPNTD